MSGKQRADWGQFLADDASSLPADEFTFTTGVNGLLDGFDFDTPQGEGIEDGGRLPETKGLSGLPDGFIQIGEETLNLDELTGIADEDGLELEESVSGAKEASLVDLDWLDPTQEQDPDRLPDNETTLNSQAQLEEAWGTERRTDGLQLVPNKDLEIALHEESIKELQHSEVPVGRTASAEDIKDVVLRALRRAHFQHPMGKIKAEIVAALGRDAVQTKKAVERIEQEYGLLGNVFIRASAFPGMKNGQWVKEVRRSCRTAKYVITDDETVAAKLGMQMVADVPWGEALEQYQPMMKAAGYQPKGTPQQRLLGFFTKDATTPAPEASYKPVVTPVVATREEAQKALAAAVPAPVVASPEKQVVEAKQKLALVQIAKWVKAGRLTLADAFQLRDAGHTPAGMLKAAATLMAGPQSTSVYEGTGTDVLADAHVARQQVGASLEQQASEVEAKLIKQAKVELVRAVKAGLLTKDEGQRILGLNRTGTETRKIVARAIQVAGDMRKQALAQTQVAEYVGEGAHLAESSQGLRDRLGASDEKKIADMEAALHKKVQLDIVRAVKAGMLTKDEAKRIAGLRSARAMQMEFQASLTSPVAAVPFSGVVLTAAPVQEYNTPAPTPELSGVLKAAKESGIKAGEFRALLKWARQKMSEGVAGQEMDLFLRGRFSAPLLRAASGLLNEVRATHEGLSGHLYVDAAAYASPDGVTGCEQGGLRHRANPLKYVLAMSRCASCTLKNADGVCQTYNKKLASKPPVKDVKAYQKKALEMADAPEEEKLASLFNPAEYDLRNDAATHLTLETTASTEMLDGFQFGEGIDL